MLEPLVFENVTPDNIYCYPEGHTNCPITELKIESKTNADIALARGSKVLEIIENESYVVFSINQTDSKPPTTIRSGYAPCINQFEQSTGPETPSSYPAELSQAGCTYDRAQKTSTDSRFTRLGEEVGFDSNEYVTQTESGVIKILEASALYFTYVNDHEAEKTESKYYPWTRPTINWSLACELDGRTRQDAYELYENQPIDLHPINYRRGLNNAALWFLWMPWVSPCLACMGPVMATPKADSGRTLSNEDAIKIMRGCFYTGVILAYGMCLVVSSFVFWNIDYSHDYIDK